MANNYLQFSEILAIENDEQRKWLEDFMDNYEGEDYDPDYPEDKGPRFDYEFDGDGLWIYADEYGNIEDVIAVVQAFLAKFRSEEVWTLTYSETCSKPRIGEFGGGAIVVCADDCDFVNAHGWAEERASQFKKEAKEKKDV